MTLLEALILGLVQGATEFLPVSSSGHLVIGQTLLGVEVPGAVFEVAVHLATLVSVLIIYRTRVLSLIAGVVTGKAESLRYVGFLLLASIPAAFVGILFEDALTGLFDRPIVAGFALLVTGGLLWSVRGRQGTADGSDEAAPLVGISTTAAIAMGLGQAVAIVPGISRSGTTVVIALWLGVRAEKAAEFSFLMSVPVIGGAAILSLGDVSMASSGLSAAALWAASIAAASSGVLAIFTFVRMLNRGTFHRFAPYCWLAGAAFIAYLLL